MEADELDYLLPVDCQNTYFDTWDRHNSIAFSTATKGLHNAPGENNCFVNSAVQVFWHLDVFRRSYRRLSGHTCMGNSCIFCALKVIFTQFQFSDQSSLHPDALRKALAETFVNQQRFQLGHMDDAAECFENILRRIHFHIASSYHEDTCTAPHCLPHQKFSLNIVEKVVCPCGASSNPLKFTEMVHYISAKALVSQARVMQETGDMLHPDRFGLLLRNTNAMGDIRDCPGGCGKSVQIRRTLLNSPDVVSIGLVWDSDHPNVETTTEVARTIGTAIYMQDVFHSVMQDVRTLPKLQLVGLVCYYGKHYSTFVFHSKLQIWIYFDDATVREIGKSWEDVVDKCSKGRYQPLLLLYANPNAGPVPVETAPKKRTMASGFGIPGGPDEENNLDRTHESISSHHSYHRSRTPNPEQQQKKQALLPRARSVTPSTCEYENRNSDHIRQQSFIMAMSSKPEGKLRFGGQASSSGNMPGPMTPFSEHHGLTCNPLCHSSQSSTHEDDSYSDYTLSTSCQYRRPSMEGFEPAKLPLTPNLKGHDLKDNFRKECLRADVVRYQIDQPRQQEANPFSYQQYQGQIYENQNQGPDQTPILLAKTGKAAMFYQGADHSHVKQRSVSQDGDEVFMLDNSSNEGPTQHTIIKPKANSQNCDQTEGLTQSHTPVQSGLATLPRKKKDPTKDLSSYLRSGTCLNQDELNQANVNGNMSLVQDHRAVPNVSGRPPPIPGKYPVTTDEKTDGKKADKKAKKLTKKELKKAEKKLKSDLSKSQPDLSGMGKTTIQLPVAENSSANGINIQQPKEFHDYPMTYIDRKMVESILKHQGLQKNSSAHNNNSSSTTDTDIVNRLVTGKQSDGSTHTDASFDNVSLGSHKDSGYGSSDRNSSSSTGSGTVDPYIQYFISKSMVVPRNLNPQFLQQPHHQMVSDFSAPTPQVYRANIGQTGGQYKDLSAMSREEMGRHLYETLMQRKLMHPIKESSQEDILKVLPKDHTANSTPVRGPSPLPVSDGLSKEGRPPPIPPKNFAAFQVSKSSHQREPSIDSLDKDEVENDYFISMCEKADDLMDSCILAETKEDLTLALQYCDSALGCLKEAMNQIDISNKALVYAQKKHNSCLLKSRSLFKRASSQVSTENKRSSVTSSDSDNSEKPIRRETSREHLLVSGRGTPTQGQSRNPHQDSAESSARKSPATIIQQVKSGSTQARDGQTPGIQPCPVTSMQQQLNSQMSYPNSQSTLIDQQQQSLRSKSHVSRSSAADRFDSDSNHSRSGSNSSSRSSSSVPCGMSQPVPQTQTFSENPSSKITSTQALLDSYGALPRNRQNRRTSDPTGSSEVLKACLNRKKNIQNMNGSSSNGGDGIQKKMNQAEMKEQMENNNVQRQMQQLVNQPLKQTSTEFKQQAAGVKSQLEQRICNDGNEKRGSVASSGSNDSSTTNSQTHNTNSQTHSAISFVEKSSHCNQGSNASSSTYPQNHLQPLHGSNNQPVVSLAQNSSQSNFNPQFGTSGVQLLPQPQQQQLHSQSATSQSYHQQLQSPYVSGHPFPGQMTQPVSGYSQPLPGHRSVPAFSQPGLKASTQLTSSANQSQVQIQQSLPNQGVVHPGMRYDNQAQLGNFPIDSSQSYNQSALSQTSFINPIRSSQQNSVQSLTHCYQNLNINRKNSGGPPPPPPARTTSNPDFKQQVPPQQQYQQSHHHLQQDVGPHLEVGACSQQRSIVHVHSNNYTDGNRSIIAESALRQCQPTISLDSTNTNGVQLKHATSATGLNCVSSAPRPLERYASQPDCQKLVDPASYSSKDLLPSSFAAGQLLSNNANARSEILHGNGVNRNLLLTSEASLSQKQNHLVHSALPNQADEIQSKTSVRSLASKFDSAPGKPPIKPKPTLLGTPRTRSKSESGSKKPKSVLKTKKNKGNKIPRKSVTFAEDISNFAAGYESAAELTSFSASGNVSDRAYFSDDDDNLTSKVNAYSDNEIDDGIEDSSNSDDMSMVREELACQLCRKREIEMGKAYCTKCSFYMSRLVRS